MSEESIISTAWRYARFTPMRDVIRLRFSDRLDVHKQIELAELAEEHKEIVRIVIRKSKLWRFERLDVADELIAHFRDASESGVSVEDSIKNFGDPKLAAKLIRWAKLGKRSVVWLIFRWLTRLVMLGIVLYVGLLVYFFSGKPSPDIDYLADLNQQIDAIPHEQRAWPIYRDAVLKLDWKKPYDPKTDPGDMLYGYQKPAPEIVTQWANSHQDAINLIHKATAYPKLGMKFGRPLDAEDNMFDEPWSGNKGSTEIYNSLGKDSLFGRFEVQRINSLRICSEAVFVDSISAFSKNELNRWMMDIRSALAISDHFKQLHGYGVADIDVFRIRYIAQRHIARALMEKPSFLGDKQLIELAHLISIPQLPSDLCTNEYDIRYAKDMVQRIYTKNSNDDGRITTMAWYYYSDSPLVKSSSLTISERDMVLYTQGPWSIFTTASRKEALNYLDSIFEKQKLLLDRPRRDSLKDFWALFKELEDEHNMKKYWVVRESLGRVHMNAMMADDLLAERDGLSCAIGCELFKRKNERYPARLSELVPEYLPSIPADRLSGKELKYKLVDGKPFLYSVGNDMDDDDGRVPVNRSGAKRNSFAHKWGYYPIPNPYEGDWIVYPPTDDEQE